ncbi:MAG TPA: SprT family zinc-dependent metalloprotease [Burkholderiaceae bacterium]|nr:SprT family zinc-dependent metalloprotease [Burkholderiaceae bacterium]
MPSAPGPQPPPQLSLFDEAPPPAPATARAEPAFATPVAPAAPATLPPAALALARHPRSNREARLDGHLVGYEFRRARRKSIGLVVSPEGLVVSAPRWVPLGEVEAMLQEKARWVLRKLREQEERAQRMAAQRIEWRDGASVPFLGETVIVVLDPRTAGSVLHTAEDTLPGVPRLTLHVGLPQHAAPEQIRDAVQSWLQRQARRVFEERCRHFAAQLGVRWTRLALSSATTRWGSASADGAIRLHWRLIHFALPTIDYVVAHELAHLRVMDHSPRFWDVVRSVIPDVERWRVTLRDEALPVFD